MAVSRTIEITEHCVKVNCVDIVRRRFLGVDYFALKAGTLYVIDLFFELLIYIYLYLFVHRLTYA